MRSGSSIEDPDRQLTIDCLAESTADRRRKLLRPPPCTARRHRRLTSTAWASTPSDPPPRKLWYTPLRQLHHEQDGHETHEPHTGSDRRRPRPRAVELAQPSRSPTPVPAR